MYLYESFESSGTFTLLRPVYLTLVIIVLLLFLAIVIPAIRRNFITGFTVVSLSAVLVIVSAQIMFYHAVIVDEIGLGGDSIAFYSFLIVTAASFVNLLIYFGSKSRKITILT